MADQVAVTTQIAVDHLAAATAALASGGDPLPVRLQAAWHDHVQHVWEQRCLSAELLVEFRSLWERYTAPSDDPRSTVVRALTPGEQVAMAIDVVTFTVRVVADAASTA
jgi:hypothetical protein